jgi:hypothetical protein
MFLKISYKIKKFFNVVRKKFERNMSEESDGCGNKFLVQLAQICTIFLCAALTPWDTIHYE